jgi:predicted transposase YdaD
MTYYFLSLTQRSTQVAIRAISKIFNKKETNEMIMSTLEEQYVKGKTEGEAKGKAKGKAEGKIEGKAEGEAKAIIRILTRRIGKPSTKLQKQIEGVNNIDQLDELIDFALTCVSLDEFATAFN